MGNTAYQQPRTGVTMAQYVTGGAGRYI